MKITRTRDYIVVDFEIDKVLKIAGTTRKKWNKMGEFEQNKMLRIGFQRMERP